MATARLVYETPENLDARTVAHAKTAGFVRQLVASEDLIATLGQDGLVVRGLDCEVRWTAEHDPDVWRIALVGDELVAVGFQAISVWGLDGEHKRRFDVELDFEATQIAFDEVGGQVAILGEEGEIAQAAIIDLVSGEKLHQWDMTEDYDFGDWIQVNGVMFHDGRLVLGVAQQITVWVDGELEQGEWRRGKNLGQYTDESWAASARYLMEVASDSRGLVVYDAQTLELLAQPGASGDFCGEFGGKVYAWSDQHIAMWDGGEPRFYKPDWRGHYHATFTPNGAYAVSVSLKGEVCVQRVADFETLDAEPQRVWAMVDVTAFAANAAGTHACVVRGVPNTMSEAEVIDLATGRRRNLGKIQPTDTMHFVDDRHVFATTGRYVEPASVMTWSVDAEEVETTELPGEFMGSGKSWIATKQGDNRLVVRGFEGGELHELATHDLPESWDVQTMPKRRYAYGFDDAYNGVLADLETGEKFMTEEGTLGGELLATTEWDTEYVLKVRELPGGAEIGAWRGDVGEHLVLDSRRQVLFSANEGALYSWTPPDAAENVFSEPNLGTIRLSSDERYLVAAGPPVRVFDAANPTEPMVELALPHVTLRAEVAGDFLLVTGFHGMYAIYAIEP